MRLSCDKCGRSGQYRKPNLIAQFARDIPLPDLRVAIAPGASGRGSCTTPAGALRRADSVDNLMMEQHSKLLKRGCVYGRPKNLGRVPTRKTFGCGCELVEDATMAGFYGELIEAVKPYGGAEGYVRRKLKDVPR